jgi:hypothetical protein
MNGLDMSQLDKSEPTQAEKGRKLIGRVVLLLLLSAVALTDRLYHERHYGRMFVRLSQRLSSDASMNVFVRRVDGVISPLTPGDWDRRLYSRDSEWSKAAAIVLTGNAIDSIRPEEVEVRIGAGWRDTRVLPVRGVQMLPLDSSGLQQQRRQLLFEQAFILTVDAANESVLPGNAGVLNWQGDFLLVAHVLCLGLLYFLLLIGGGRMLIRLGRLHVNSLSTTDSTVRLAAEVIRFFVLVLSVHLASLWLRQLSVMRESEPFVIGMMAAMGIAALLAAWFRIVERTPTEKKLSIKMLLVTLFLTLLKLYWLSLTEGLPRSDYLAYYEYGKKMADGDWEAISRSAAPQSAIYLRRAAVFTYPVARCFGPSISAVETVHACVQCITAVIFCLLVRRIAGIRAAARALPLLLISPEIWYQAGMVTHNVFGYFFIVATWLAFDCFLQHASRQQQLMKSRSRRLAAAMFWGVAVGIGIGMIELTKGYGIMIEAGLAATVIFGLRVMRSLCGSIADGLLFRPGRWAFLLMALATHRSLVVCVDTALLERSGLQIPKDWASAVISSVESAGPGGGDSLAVWLSHYHYGMPPSRLRPMLFRKLLHEKLGAAQELLKCVLRKNRTLSSVIDAMAHSQDSVNPVTKGPKVDNLRFGSVQFTIGNAIMLGLGVLFIGRLLMPGPALSNWPEVLPVVTTGLVMAVIYLAVESHAYYSLNIIYPMCWSGGVVLDRLRQPTAPTTSPGRFSALRLLSMDRLKAAVAGIALLGCYCLIGAGVDRSGLTFFRVSAAAGGSAREVEEGTVVKGLPENAVSGVSRVHGWLEFRTESGMIHKGERITQQFVVQCGGSRIPGLSFFISGNQRARINRINNNWNSLPLQYSVSIEDFKLAENRPLEELARPKFLAVSRKFWDPDGKRGGRNVTVTVSLECTEDIPIGRLSPPPAIALEYFH